MKLENEIDDLLLPYKMDIAMLNKISNKDLINHIENDGKVFYDKSSKLVFNELPVDYRSIVKNN